jgi:hypothetical protein
MSLSVDASLGTTNSKKHVKIKNVISSWVDPLYGTLLDIIFDKKTISPKK